MFPHAERFREPSSVAWVSPFVTAPLYNSETNDFLDMELNIWFLSQAGSTIGSGTYSVTPVPEPSYLFLLMPIVALVGLRDLTRKQFPGGASS
jgi:hypothetical protein